jgi:hypothetical protein
MKIKGKTIEQPAEEVIVFPRKSGNLVFKAKPVKNYEDFEKICPTPVPESILKPGGVQSQDVENPKYKKELDDWAACKTHWMILKSLSATPDLEWDTVDMSKPETYANYVKELEECGLTAIEVSKLFEIIQVACGLNQDKIDEATAAFLAGQVEL